MDDVIYYFIFIGALALSSLITWLLIKYLKWKRKKAIQRRYNEELRRHGMWVDKNGEIKHF